MITPFNEVQYNTELFVPANWTFWYIVNEDTDTQTHTLLLLIYIINSQIYMLKKCNYLIEFETLTLHSFLSLI